MLTTNRAVVMTEVISLFNQKMVEEIFLNFFVIDDTHQENLCAKSIQLENVMSVLQFNDEELLSDLAFFLDITQGT